MTKRINRSYTAEFKQEAVALITEQGYSVPKDEKEILKKASALLLR